MTITPFAGPHGMPALAFLNSFSKKGRQFSHQYCQPFSIGFLPSNTINEGKVSDNSLKVSNDSEGDVVVISLVSCMCRFWLRRLIVVQRIQDRFAELLESLRFVKMDDIGIRR